PANDGGANITSYSVTCNPGNHTASGGASPITVGGLTNFSQYACSVVAINSAGTSLPSSTVNVTPLPAFGTPGSFVATAINASQVAMTWSGVSDTTGYEIHRSTGGVAFSLLTTVPAGTTTYTDSGLAADTSYLYKILARQNATTSPFSPIDPATTTIFANEPLTAGTLIQAVHIAQLRTA